MLQEVFDKMKKIPRIDTSSYLLPNQIIQTGNRYIVPHGFDGKRDDYKIYEVPEDVSFEPKLTFGNMQSNVDGRKVTVRCDWTVEFPLSK